MISYEDAKKIVIEARSNCPYKKAALNCKGGLIVIYKSCFLSSDGEFCVFAWPGCEFHY